MVILCCGAQASHCGGVSRCRIQVDPKPLDYQKSPDFKIQGSTNNILKLFQVLNRVILFSFTKIPLARFLNPGPLEMDFDKNNLADSDGMTTKDSGSLGNTTAGCRDHLDHKTFQRGPLGVFKILNCTTLAFLAFTHMIASVFVSYVFGKNTKH